MAILAGSGDTAAPLESPGTMNGTVLNPVKKKLESPDRQEKIPGYILT